MKYKEESEAIIIEQARVYTIHGYTSTRQCHVIAQAFCEKNWEETRKTFKIVGQIFFDTKKDVGALREAKRLGELILHMAELLKEVPPGNRFIDTKPGSVTEES